MNQDRCLIIAEAGVNHNGRLDLALQLCDAAKTAGADVVKFQTWKTEKIITHDVEQAEYQAANTGRRESQFDMLKRLELPYGAFRKIKRHCDEIGITFASTADEEESLDFLVKLGIPFVKVGSGDVGNISFLRRIGSKNLPVILSTGMSTLADVDMSVNALKEGGAKDFILLHCTTSYPCPFEEVNLRAMLTLRDAFHLPIGYSDHTEGQEMAVAAVAMGAKVVEKHFTLDRNMEGPDHAASMEPLGFKRMVEGIRKVEQALGDGIKVPTGRECGIKDVVKKRVVALRDISEGEVLSPENICVKRSDVGEGADKWDQIIGRRTQKGYRKDEGILA